MRAEHLTEPSAHDQPSAEDREREAAWRRGEAAAPSPEAQSSRDPTSGKAPPEVATRAFAALADSVRDYAIFLMDPRGVITFWGEGARLIKWWSPSQAEGAHLRLLYPAGGSDDGTAEDHIAQAAEGGEYTGEGERVRSDGSTFWAGVTLTALRDEEGALIGFAKVTRDLTARRAADALLQSAAASAESARIEAVAASLAKSRFLATVSHEIRTPVNAVMGYLELLDLEIDGPLTPGQRRHLSRASASSLHLLQVISEVLDFSRIEADRVDVQETTFRLGDAVVAALALVAPQARARGLQITDAVSGYAAGLAARGDEQRVRQILVNLLANAVKFTAPRNGEPGRITVSVGSATRASTDAPLTGTGPWVYVRVEDTGAGIPPDRLEPIFEPFVQADMALTRPHGGTGLGLAISRRLARLMDGDVTARSEEGVGSTFFLWLPAAPVESLATGGVEGHGPGAPDTASGALPGAELPESPIRSQSFAAIADAVLAELERVLHGYVARLRSDLATPSAHSLTESQVEDHLASFLADLASTMNGLDGVTGEPTPHVRDSSAIQRVVATRHGAQRARLGWGESELRREFTILREELHSAIRRRLPARLHGPNQESRAEETERALEVLTQFLAVAEQLSFESFRRARGPGLESAGDETPESGV